MDDLILHIDVISDAWIASPGAIEGYVFAPLQMGRRLTVEIFFDGAVVATLRADEFVEKLWRERRGDGCYGFSLALPPASAAGQWEVRLANLDRTLARLAHDAEPPLTAPVIGEVRWRGGLKLSGFVVDEDDARAISCLCDGHMIYQGRANGWSHITRGTRHHPVRAFDIRLPIALADGVPKSVHVYAASGEELSGSPVLLFAVPDGLHAALHRLGLPENDHPRVELFERYFPASVPFGDWSAWEKAWLPAGDEDADIKLAIAIIGDEPGRLAITSETLERQTATGWVAAAVPSDDGLAFDYQDIGNFLSGPASHCDSIVFVRNGVALDPPALSRLAVALRQAPHARLAYPDLYGGVTTGERVPWILPAFDYERFLEQCYFGELFILRRDALAGILTAETKSVFDLIFCVIEAGRESQTCFIAHLPEPLAVAERGEGIARRAQAVTAHLDRCGVAHTTELRDSGHHSRLKLRRHAERADTTILLQSNGDPVALQASIKSLRADDHARKARVIVATNADLSTFRMEAEGVEIIACGGEFDRHRLANIGLEQVETEFAFLLDADVSALSPNWHAELVGRAVDRDVAAVGLVTVTAQGQLCQAGYVLGPDFAAGEAFEGESAGAPGYGDLLLVAHEVSAISMRCALVRAALIKDAGGFDESLYPDTLRDVDMCLKLQCGRRRIILSPHLRFLDRRPSPLDMAGMASWQHLQLARFRDRWGARLLNDPLYNPNLGLDGAPYSGLAWPPRDQAPRYRFHGDQLGGD